MVLRVELYCGISFQRRTMAGKETARQKAGRKFLDNPG
jgi:hypothetical protein